MKIQERRVVKQAGTAVAVAALLGLQSCADVPQLAPNGATIVLLANPEFIPANGGVSIISAIVTEPAGTPVPDGTVVQFFTNLGMIDREGRTNDGVARVNLISDARSGTAAVSAVSGSSTATLGSGVRIGAVLPARLILIADPSRITVSKSTHIIAMVLDDAANPVANVGVIFTTPATTEFMDSQGHPVFTDNNGVAEDVVHTKRTTAGSITVNVTVLSSGGLSGSISVPYAPQ